MTRIDLICTAENQTASDDRLTEILGGDQTGSLVVALSPEGTPPATHYGASGVFDDAFANEITGESLWVATIDTTDDPATAFEDFSTSQGLQRVNFD